jgi:hypothetical protein
MVGDFLISEYVSGLGIVQNYTKYSIYCGFMNVVGKILF